MFELIFALFWGISVFMLQGQYLLLGLLFFLLCIVSYLAYFDLRQHEVPVAALGLLPIAYGLLYFVGLVELSLYGIAIMFFIILISVSVVRFTKKDIAVEDIFGPADWFVLLVAGLFIGVEPAVIVIIISVVILGMYYIAQYLVFKKTIKGVPFLFWYLPILYLYTLFLIGT